VEEKKPVVESGGGGGGGMDLMSQLANRLKKRANVLSGKVDSKSTAASSMSMKIPNKQRFSLQKPKGGQTMKVSSSSQPTVEEGDEGVQDSAPSSKPANPMARRRQPSFGQDDSDDDDEWET
jgi:hypothetical protein